MISIHGIPVRLLGGGLVRRIDERPVEVGKLIATDGPITVKVIGHEGSDGRIEVREHLTIESHLLEPLIGVPPFIERLVSDLAHTLLVNYPDCDLRLLSGHVAPHLAAHVEELGSVDSPSLVSVVLVEDDLCERNSAFDGLVQALRHLFLLFRVVRGAIKLVPDRVDALLGEPAVAHTACHAARVVQRIVVLDRFSHVGY